MACKLFIKRKFSPQKAPLQGEAEYISKVAKTEKEVSSLIEARFEYVTDFEGAKIFRKAKM